jgi:hypothetical protein
MIPQIVTHLVKFVLPSLPLPVRRGVLHPHAKVALPAPEPFTALAVLPVFAPVLVFVTGRVNARNRHLDIRPLLLGMGWRVWQRDGETNRRQGDNDASHVRSFQTA